MSWRTWEVCGVEVRVGGCKRWSGLVLGLTAEGTGRDDCAGIDWLLLLLLGEAVKILRQLSSDL